MDEEQIPDWRTLLRAILTPDVVFVEDDTPECDCDVCTGLVRPFDPSLITVVIR